MQSEPRAHKGIILAGGSGTRLHPLTLAISKQMLPVYDKPMIYYPLSTLMAAGIQEIAVITTPEDQACFRKLLGGGEQWGIRIEYIVQPTPDGLAQAYILSEAFLDGAPSVLILGDNVFHGSELAGKIKYAMDRDEGASVFGYRVPDPERFGVVSLGADGKAASLVEKPTHPQSDIAVTGLYVLDSRAPGRAKSIAPSPRGELEITCLLNTYLQDKALSVHTLGPSSTWLDTGTMRSLFSAAQHVEQLQSAIGAPIGSPEIVAFRNGWIDLLELAQLASRYKKSGYGSALKRFLMSAAPTSATSADRQARREVSTPKRIAS